jgi:hypothetical protein
MSPTIRIDDDVYNWLQSQAVPFEDNPNSVLRRIAGLGNKSRGTAGTARAGRHAPSIDHTETPADRRPGSSSPDPSPGCTRAGGAKAGMTAGEGEVAGQSPDFRRSGRRAPLATGRELIKRWKIPAREARFHRDGEWYQHLTNFPAAYCDRHGYVLFETEDDLRQCSRVQLGKEVHVSGGIAAIPDYRRVEDPISGA